MMQKLKEEITAAANRELNRANEQFPLFTSKHEGVAVAYEELEESKEALEELETSFKCLWDDVRGKRKKLGLENAKYIYIIAFEEYTRPHFHLLISGGIDRDELERMWGKCDRPNTRNISPDENFLLTGLATYITQNPHGTKRWCPSKNLKKPDEPKRSYSKFRKAKVEKMAFDSSVLQAEMEKAYPGFTFLDAEVKHNGVNAAFYIYARMVKKGEKPKGKPQKRKRGNKA